MNLKRTGKVFTSKSVGTGPSSYEKRIYRAAVSQRLRNAALNYGFVNVPHRIHNCTNTLYDYVIINPATAELNPICHLLALLGAHHIFHVSRIRINY